MQEPQARRAAERAQAIRARPTQQVPFPPDGANRANTQT
nr:MAG TPA: hypothetical protein [Caudoviricetes sp.]